MNGRAFWSLVKVQLLAGLNLNVFIVKGKRAKAWLAALGLVVLFLPSYASIVAVQVKSFHLVRSSGLPLEGSLLAGLYSATQLLILLASIPAVYAALYQSNELTLLLPLPFRPRQILAAKLLTIYIPELLLGLAFFLPSFVLYVAHGGMPLSIVPLAVLILLLLPAIPLCLVTILSIGVANIPGIGRNKWFWFAGITIAVLAASLLLTVGLAPPEGQQTIDYVEMRMHQIRQAGWLIPGAQFAMYSLVATDWSVLFHAATYFAVVGAYLVLTMAVGARFYIGPVLRGPAAAIRRHARAARIQATSFLRSAIRKEMLCTLKDPAVAMNGLGGYIALPLLAVTYTIMKIQTRGKVDIIGQLSALLQSGPMSEYLPYMVVGVALTLALFGGLSSLFSASYSKDGKRLWLEKSLPVPEFQVFVAKFLAGYALVTPLNLLTILVISLMVPFSVGHWLYVLLVSQVVLAWSGAIGLAIDCSRPKLVWKDTVQAVKQNVNVVFALGVTMAGVGLNVLVLWGLFRLKATAPVVYSIPLLLNALVLALALLAGRLAGHRFRRLIL